MKNNSVFVIGGGPSLTNFDFKQLDKHSNVICPNYSILSYPKAKYFITVDLTFRANIRSKFIMDKNTTKVFVVNFGSGILSESEGRIFDVRSGMIYDLEEYDLIIKSKDVNSLGESFKDFRTCNNSGACAIQFAYLLGFDNIYLLGMDFTGLSGKYHYHNDYINKSHIVKNIDKFYDSTLDMVTKIKKSGRNIYSCSKISRLNKVLEYRDFESI